ncbi:hypothetical protein P4422_21560, partial [Bacillus thuringiensis]
FQKEHFVLLTIELLSFLHSLIIPAFSRYLPGSKTHTSKFSESKEVIRGICKLYIGRRILKFY